MSNISESALKEADLDYKKANQLLEIAKYAATKGGSIVMKHYGNIQEVKSKSNPGDLVTNADLECEKEIVNYLRNETPDISILAEESGDDDSKNKLKWCIDPLDGTTNFTHGYPLFATSIGLIWENKPILGAISVPYFSELYYAAPGIGSFCNSRKLEITSSPNLEHSLLVTGFAYDRKEVIENNYAEFCWMTHKTRGVRRGGAAAVDMAYVAAGKVDGYWERGLAKWDLAAGVAIVEMAGGTVCNYPNGNFDLSNGRVVACSPGIKAELLYELGKVNSLDPFSLRNKDL